MRTFALVPIGAATLFAAAALAGTQSFDAALKLPPYAAPNLRSAEAAVPVRGETGYGPYRLDRLTFDAQERQCRRDLQYASQARGDSQIETVLQREFSAQSVYDFPGFGHVPYCIWYPQWRLRRLFGPAGGRSIPWPGPRGESFAPAGGTG